MLRSFDTPSQQCREVLRRVWFRLNFVWTSSQHFCFVLEMSKPFINSSQHCSQSQTSHISLVGHLLRGWWGRLTRHGLNISQHDSTNVQRMLRPFDGGLSWQKHYSLVKDRLEYQPLFGKMSPRCSSLLGEERRPDSRERRKSRQNLIFIELKQFVYYVVKNLVKGRTLFWWKYCLLSILEGKPSNTSPLIEILPADYVVRSNVESRTLSRSKCWGQNHFLIEKLPACQGNYDWNTCCFLTLWLSIKICTVSGSPMTAVSVERLGSTVLSQSSRDCKASWNMPV